MKKSMSIICIVMILLTSIQFIGTTLGENSEGDVCDIPIFINLKATRFDPLKEEPNIPLDLQYLQENNYFLVQCTGPIMGDWVERIKDTGAIILGYIPDYTYIIHIKKDIKKNLEKLPFVRWMGSYHPAYKIEENLIFRHGQVQLNVMVFKDKVGYENLKLVKDKISALGGKILHEGGDNFVIVTEVDALKIKDIAFIPQVEWIDEYTPPKPLMDNVRVFTGAESPLHENGFDGTGIIGEVKDSGLDLDHVEFEGQILATDGSVSEDSHGTSTFGIVFAKGVNDQAKGMMPGGQGIFCSYGVERKQSIANLVNNWGGLFQSNSWHSGSADSSYQSNTQENDESVFEYDVTMLYGSGNGGGDQSITREATAKNVIAVGAVNHYDNDDRSDDQHTGAQGNKGPTDDGRIKPDVVGVYDSIYTTTSGGGYTSSFGGTSGATPIAAGAVGLIYEMFRENHFGNNPTRRTPHAATVKAILIADAYQYDFTQADRFAQGWGLVDVGNVYNIGENHFIDDEGNALKTGETISYKITPTTSTPLKISLVWTDVPGTTSASKHLINDLNLRVIDPTGEIYLGNAWLDGSKWSYTDGEVDHLNNVENVFIENPISGEWTIEVMAENIPLDGVLETMEVDQSYALVASGVNKYDHDLAVYELKPPRFMKTGEEQSINVTIINIGKNTESSIQVRFLVDNITVDSTLVNSIDVGEIVETNFIWTPSESKEYLLSVYIEPLIGETSTGDNRKDVIIDTSLHFIKILVDDGHGTDWRHNVYYSHIETMGQSMYRIYHTDGSITSELLEEYDIFITAWPTQMYTTQEISSIQNFVAGGGGLLVIGKDEQDILNDLTDYAGIEWGTGFVVLFVGDTSEINEHEITENVEYLYFGSHELPLIVSDPAEEIAYTYDGISYGRVAIAVSEYEQGRIVAIADEECLNSEYIYEDDNIILGENIIKWFSNQRPISIIDFPLNNSEHLPTETILFDGSSSYDPEGDTLTYLWNSNISGEIGNTASFSALLIIGHHTITLEVSDNSGKSGTAEIQLRVLGPPTVEIQSPEHGALINGIVEITGTASDLDGTVEKVEVQIVGATWKNATDTSSQGDWSTWSLHLNTGELPDGDHIINARALDNDHLNSETDNIGIKVDNTPPNIITGPTVTSKTETTATIEWETDEASYSLIDYWVKGPSNVQNISSDSDVTSHSIVLSDLLPFTTYQYKVYSKDSIGNTGPPSQVKEFTTEQPPDSTPPQVIILEPPYGEELNGDVIISVDTSDEYGIAKVEFYIDGKLKHTQITTPYSWVWDTTQGSYPDGQYSIKVIAIDTNGNEASDEIMVSLDNEQIAPIIFKKKVTPNTIDTKDSQEVLIKAEIIDPENHMEYVVVDLSSIGGSASQTMYDDGSHGDEVAGDYEYSYRASVSSDISEGEKTLTITLGYGEGKSVDAQVTLYMISYDEEEPVDDGQIPEEEEESSFPWLMLILIIILIAAVFGGGIAVLKSRRRPQNEVVVVPFNQPVYYQNQTGYYPTQADQYQQKYYRRY